MENYYQVLALTPDTPISRIKKLFRKEIQQLLKDRNQNEAKFVSRCEAFYVLKNVKRKNNYDRLYEMKYGNSPLLDRKVVKKWEEKISNASVKGKAFGKKLYHASDDDLKKRIKRKKRSGTWDWLFDIFVFILDIFPFSRL